jgi:ligand-binding sensor domain-containing protein
MVPLCELPKRSGAQLSAVIVQEERRRMIFITLLLWLLSHPASAERLPLKAYTAADGLVREQINRIVRDSGGFLWVCTPEGLSRFDGSRYG